MVINLGALWLFADLIGVAAVASSAIAVEISIVWNFLLNNAWTFRDKNEHAGAGFVLRMLRYNLVCLVGMAIQLAVFIAITGASMNLLALHEPGIWKYPAQLAGIAVGMVWNFLSNFHWTWARKSESVITE